MKTHGLGDLEELVLLAVCGLVEEAYAVSVQQRIEQRGGRETSMGAVYTTLDRLEQKGYLASQLGAPTAQRGGRSKRYYAITPAGTTLLTATRRARERMWEDIDVRLLPGYRAS
jgi:DNA-binding PadR family transcriptional regulator